MIDIDGIKDRQAFRNDADINELVAEYEALHKACVDYARMYLQDEADGWVGNTSQTHAARKMFDALGMPYQIERATQNVPGAANDKA